MRIFILLFIFIAHSAFAGGPPIDSTGKILTPYISIKLDPNQKKHLQNNRWLELTSAQQKILHSLNLPKYVDVVDPFHKDCTCAQIYAMWYTADSVAFVIGETYNPSDEEYKWYNSVNFPQEKNHTNNLFITESGQLSFKGRIVDIKDIYETLNAIKVLKTDEIRYIRIYQPPLKNNKLKNKVIETKTSLLKSIPPDLRAFWL